MNVDLIILFICYLTKFMNTLIYLMYNNLSFFFLKYGLGWPIGPCNSLLIGLDSIFISHE